MLSGERWVDARESFVLLKEKWQNIYPDEKEILLAEHYKTQRAIEALKLQSRTPNPSQIPHMDEITPALIEDTNKATCTSVIGMPNSGKTTTVEIVAETRAFDSPVLVDEAYKGEKDKLEKSGNLNFETLIENIAVRQYTELLDAAIEAKVRVESGLNDSGLVILDRLSITDIPMLRTHYLLGNIRSPLMLVLENMFLNDYCHQNGKFSNVLISTFITPEESLSRQDTNENRGRIMNPPFLHVLYEQYIRFHYEMMNFEKIFSRKRGFTYCAIDMSSDDSYIRFRKLERAINWSSIAQTGWPDARDIDRLLKDESF